MQGIKVSKKALIITVCFALAIIIVLGISTYNGFKKSNQYKMMVEHNYQRALMDLNDHVSNVNSTLCKGMYCGSNEQLGVLATKLWSEAQDAKASLAQLPVSSIELDNMQKFLSQVGEYSLALNRRIESGQEMTGEDVQSLRELNDYATSLSDQMNNLYANVTMGGVSLATAAYTDGEINREQDYNVADGFKSMEEEFTNYPSLIYDGPFSDHITNKKSKYLAPMETVSPQVAKQTAMRYLNCEEKDLSEKESEDGNLPTYDYNYGDALISVTKQGGIVAEYNKGRQVQEKNIEYDAAVQKAYDFLNDKGFGEFRETYYQSSNNICTINFAFMQNGYMCYPDLIKVGVALDNGEILTCEAKGFIMNHLSRTMAEPKITQSDAQKKLNKLLKVKSCNMAVIPLDTTKEAECYEFLCEGEKGENILVYINTQTGEEEKLLILLQTDGGTLAI